MFIEDYLIDNMMAKHLDQTYEEIDIFVKDYLFNNYDITRSGEIDFVLTQKNPR